MAAVEQDRGWAEPGWQDALGWWWGGRIVAPSPALPRSKLQGRGPVHSPPVVPPLRRGDVDSRESGNDEGGGGNVGRGTPGNTRRGCLRCLGGCAGRSGCWEWQECEARLPGAAGAGRPARRRWRTPRRTDGTDPAPRPQWPGVRQHPAPSEWRADGQAPPCRMTRRGVGHDPAP